jgi:hypothetical protein
MEIMWLQIVRKCKRSHPTQTTTTLEKQLRRFMVDLAIFRGDANGYGSGPPYKGMMSGSD